MQVGVKAKYAGLCNLFVTFACYHFVKHYRYDR
jgi:hypothetical protein